MSSPAGQSSSVPVFTVSSSPPSTTTTTTRRQSTSTTADLFRRASRAIVGENPNPLALSEEERLSQLRSKVPSQFTITPVTRGSPGGNFDGFIKLGNKTKCIGRFNDHDAASSACRAQSPPIWQESDACNICTATFAVLRPRHHCRNCGCSVCSECSKNTWPSRCLPDYNLKSENVRVCDSCHILARRFKEAVENGDVDCVADLALTGNVNLTCPLYPGVEYPFHVAARSGKLNVLQLICSPPFYVSLYYTSGGRTMVYTTVNRGTKMTVMQLAAINKDLEMITWLHREKNMPISLISETRILQ
eukprot:CAMPEP_0118652746 /NCGR_PEP_ID=MMETSP0785-20121206/11475_1 /TAXON_ID=91992 /ORGANISM="Bolidomonas pacifica, Strain CCMP 1866" /LENGTH=303 /DNA_ID=CAMNT_0006545269 /DNA_START=74 /DNA_END=982 /DNA_ORIENTATION=+